MSKPTLSKALSTIHDLKARFRFYRIGQTDESAEVPGALVVDAEILNALKVIVDVAEASENYIHLLQFGGDTQQALTNIFAQSGETMAAKKRNPDVGLEPGSRGALRCPCCERSVDSVASVNMAALDLPGHCPATLCPRCRRRASLQGSYARCFVVCQSRDLVIERVGSNVEIDNRKGTTAVCNSVAEACETLDSDPAFGAQP